MIYGCGILCGVDGRFFWFLSIVFVLKVFGIVVLVIDNIFDDIFGFFSVVFIVMCEKFDCVLCGS